MKYYVQLMEDNRLGVLTEFEEFKGDDYVEIELPDDFDFPKFNDYKYIDGQLVHDKRPISPAYEVMQLKNKLAETDYVIPKMMEAQLTGIALQAEEQARYNDIIKQRKEWRARINELEPLLESENMQDSTA